MRINNETKSTRPLRKFQGLTAPTPITVLTGWNRPRHLSMNTKEGSIERNYSSTVEPVCPKQSTHYPKNLPTSTSRTQYYGTIQTSELCHSDRMPTSNYIKNPMRHYKPTTQGIHLSTLNWNWTIH